MLVVETITRIRREHRDGKPIKAIARDLRLSRNTVRKAIRAPDADASYERKEQHRPQTGPFVSADGTRPCQFLGGDGVREATGGFASGYRAVKRASYERSARRCSARSSGASAPLE